MDFVISNAAELRSDSVVPKTAFFQREQGGEWSTRIEWRGDEFRIDAPPSTIDFTDNLKLVRILGESAHGEREIWP